jgi:hypothetical protein
MPTVKAICKGSKPWPARKRTRAKVLEVALDRVEGMVDGAGDFLGFLALQPMADGLSLVGDGGADVLLLAAGGDDHAALGFEVLNVAADGAHVAGQELGEVLLGEQAPLFAGFLGQAGQLVPAQAVGAAGDLLILAVHEGEHHTELAALGEGFAGALGGAEAIVTELAAFEGRGARLGNIDLVDGVHDDAGFPRAHARALHDLGEEALVLGLGGEAALLRPFLIGGSFDHGVWLWLLLSCADSIAVRTRSRHPLPFASLKATGHTPGS